MDVKRLSFLVVVIALLAMAGVAQASLRPISGTEPDPALPGGTTQLIAGPVLVDGGEVWGERQRDGSFVLKSDQGGVVHVLGHSGRAVEFVLASAGTRVAYSRLDWRCTTSRCSSLHTLADQVFRTDESGAFQMVTGCPTAGHPCPARGVPHKDVAIARDGSVAYNAYSQNAVAVGTPGAEELVPSGPAFAFSGRYLAHQQPGPSFTGLALWDRQQHRDVLKLDGNSAIPGSFDVQEDGKLFYGSLDGGGWVSPASPQPHPVDTGPVPFPPEREPSLLLRFRADRVALMYDAGDAYFVIADLNGQHRQSPVVRDRVGGFDFDGTRLTWAVRPCGVTSVAEWDTTTPVSQFPSTPTARCGTASVRHVDRRPTKSGTLWLDLSCPSSATQGCSGYVSLVARHRGTHRKFVLAFPAYALKPGTQARVPAHLRKSVRAIIRRESPVTVTATSYSQGRRHEAPSHPKRFRVYRR